LLKARVQAMENRGLPLLGGLRRVEGGRLDIPVCLSLCGEEARRLLPDRRQTGMGAEDEQAEASALMKLVECYSLHAFRERLPRLAGLTRGAWSEAKDSLGSSLITLEEILRSVHDDVSPGRLRIARQLFDLLSWTFVPALHLGEDRPVWVPVEWFWLINRHNGCSAGNTATESVLHGVCGLIERHVCAGIVRDQTMRPSILTEDVRDPVLRSLLDKFAKADISLLLKDFSLDMPAATVAALAFDPAPGSGSAFASSGIAFTAGTATSPAKAAIRALTEAAQWGGDFGGPSGESSSLPVYGSRREAEWLERGDSVRLANLPDVSAPDMLDETLRIAAALRQRNINVYCLDLTHPELRVPAHYTMAPGLDFLQRDGDDGVNLFIGMRLATEAPPDVARRGLDALGRLLPDAASLHVFRGLLLLRAGDVRNAGEHFAMAASIQRSPEREATVAYYCAYSHVLQGDWYGALPWLDRAVAVAPAWNEPWSLRGICRFKLNGYAAAAENFKTALSRGRKSAPDLANLGACCMEMGETEHAEACLTAALDMEPDILPARRRLEKLTGARPAHIAVTQPKESV
jgi:ribosomal protein S12 methylthiotransferase accessory factor